MEKIQVYHNPRCSKSRMAIEYLNSKSITFETILYLDNIPSKITLKELLNKLKVSPQELLRKNEEIYKSEIKNKNLSDEQIIDYMLKNPKLIERPIVVKGKHAVIARPTTLIDQLI